MQPLLPNQPPDVLGVGLRVRAADVRKHVVPLLGAVQAEGAVHAGLLAAFVAHVESECPLVAVRLAAVRTAVMASGARP